MTNDILVSVIVPTYNHEKYIALCLESLVDQQTNFNYEIVVGDDYSTDGNRQKIVEIANKYPGKFKLLLHEKNLGPKNFPGKNNSISCLQAATGKYWAYCEGDDYWTDTHKLQKQVDFLETHTDYNICYHRAIIKKEDQIVDFEAGDTDASDTSTLKDLLEKGNFMHTVTTVMRNPGVKTFPEWFHQIAAGDIAIYVLCLGDKKIKFMPEKMAVYNVHGQGIWGSKSRITNYLKEIKDLKIFYKALPSYSSIILNSLYNRYLFITDYYRLKGEAADTFKFETKTILFCMAYNYKPSRNHWNLAMNVVKDYFRHKVKTT
jgi:glycosyltransferase involved in cell wall biosynthesis